MEMYGYWLIKCKKFNYFNNLEYFFVFYDDVFLIRICGIDNILFYFLLW